MTERIIYAVLAVALAGMAIVFAREAMDQHAEHVRYRDFDAWTQSPGTLRSLRLRQVTDKSRRPYRIDAEYRFEFAGRDHAGHRFDLADRLYPTPEEAKAAVQAALGVTPSQWRESPRESFIDWTLAAEDLAVRVRHSSSDPLGSSLTATPPAPALFNWILIAITGLGCLLTGLAAPVMVAAIFLRLPGPPSPEEVAMGDPALPVVSFALRDAYANRVDAALFALGRLRDTEGGSPAIDEIVRALRAEQKAASSERMRQRRRALALCGKLAAKDGSAVREDCLEALATVEAYVRAHFVAVDPDNRGAG